eukprot:CAMPEP_0197022148 /NCGR_PEP_ID=MMETSP1384-20130603/3050_1 /TAXON_ID=29189 /ORGANISM="Ammonia sp." /LENGTH=578 /DNA_ID=CAMNT_0042450123 /DNA_START=56 /DNA_END=1792 /DNA_ORIENTATION=+
MSVGSSSNIAIRTAVDSILREFCKYDEEREKWQQEKLRFEQQINAYKQELLNKEKEYDVLLKRYKVLELSIKNGDVHHSKLSAMPSSAHKHDAANGADLYNHDNLVTAMKTSNIKLKLKSKKRNKQMIWARTLPTSLSPQKLLGFIDDFSGKFGSNKEQSPLPVHLETNETDAEEHKDTEHQDPAPPPKQKPTASATATTSAQLDDAKKEQEAKPMARAEPVVQLGQPQAFKLQLAPSITLRHHLDSVRTLCLNDDESVLISGSDDGTIKLWDLSKVPAGSGTGGADDMNNERLPIPITFRGHLSAVNTSCIMPNSNTLITGSFDSNVYGWKLPANGGVLMEMPSLSSLRLFEMTEHRDIVWDIAPNYSLPLIASISADNTMKIYNIETQQLQLNYAFDEKVMKDKYLGQTSIKWNNFKSQKLCISTVSGHIVLFDVEKQRILSEIIDTKQDCYTINRIYSDDNLNSNLIYCACDDSRVRLFDINNEKCIISQKVHTDSVTAMVIHSSTSSILTASHDCRLRVWDFKVNKFSCIQDLEPQDTHTQKWNEGILAMTFNNRYKWLFSGGANGIKLYQTNL